MLARWFAGASRCSFGLVATVGLSGCGTASSDPASTDAGAQTTALGSTVVAPAHARGREALSAIRARFVSRTPLGAKSFLAPSEAQSLELKSGLYVPSIEGARNVAIALPERADGAFSVSSRGARVEVTIEGANAAAADVVDGTLVYADAFAGASLVQVPTAAGTEEYVHFEARPARPEVRYRVALHGIAGLRLVGHFLEFIEADGTPALRTTAPLVMDALGQLREGTIAVEGCAVDRNGALPYGRAPTPPGASTCTVVTRFADEGLAYPVLVDPAWTSTTGTLGNPYYEVTAAPFKTSASTCSTGCVLIPGGVMAYGAYGAPAYSNNAQVYQESTQTFAAAPAAPFRGIGSVSLGDRVMVLGASNSTQVAIYSYGDPTPWTTLNPTVYGGEVVQDAKIAMEIDGDVYFDGRRSATTNDYAAIFKYSLGGTWSGIDLPTHMVSGVGHTAQYRNGYFLGGFKGANNLIFAGGGQVISKTTTVGITAVADTRTEPSGSWAAATAISAARYRGVSVRSADKLRWFFAGGQTTNATPAPASNAVDIWDGTKTIGRTLGTARTQPLGVAFGPSGALILGGRDSTGAWLKTAEHLSASGTILSTTTMAFAHSAAVTLQSGKVLALGCPSQNASCGGTQAELIGLQPNGATCATNGDCNSTFCVDGVCCNAACAGQCQACNLPASVGTCTTVTPTNGPAGYAAGSPVTGFGTTRTVCTGFSATNTCAPKCSGASATACTTPTTATVCNPATCTSGTEQQVAYCDGAGTCPAQIPKPCGTFSCGTATCNTSCTIAGPSQCAAGYTCDVATSRCISTGLAGADCAVPTDCLGGLSCVDSSAGKKVCCSVPSCSAGSYCAPASAGTVAGTCVKPLGTACTDRSECAAACVDGVCCDTTCTGQCEACNVPGTVGTCLGVNGEPRGARPKCSTGGTDVCAALACDGGTDRLKCVGYANGPATTCSAAKCEAATETPASTCNGSGSCVAKPERACAPYACGGDRCKTSCTVDTDCAAGNTCDVTKSECVVEKAVCTEDSTASTPPGSTTSVACVPFLCDRTIGRCYESCSASDQCGAGFACDSSKCVPATASSEDDAGGCTASRSGLGRGGLGFAALALAIGLARARRRAS